MSRFRRLTTIADCRSAMSGAQTALIAFVVKGDVPCNIAMGILSAASSRYSRTNFYSADASTIGRAILGNLAFVPTIMVYRGGRCLAGIIGTDTKAIEAALTAHCK